MQTRSRLLALDLDGTLLRSDKTISAVNRAAVQRAREAGIHVVLASGRMHSATARYAIEMGFPDDTYVASYNGGFVRTIGGDVLFENPIEAAHAKIVVNYVREQSLHLNYYVNDILYNERHTQWTDFYYKKTGSVAEIVGGLEKFDGQRPTKLIIVDTSERIARMLPEMQAKYSDQLTVMKTDDEYIEFMSPKANKGSAIAAIAGKLGVHQEDCIALGDNYNDLSMLQWVGTGIAMANGRPELLAQVARHAPAADDDGVAHVIDELLNSQL